MQGREERVPLALAAHLRSVKTRANLYLADLSTSGCRVVGIPDNIAPGQLIVVRPEGLGEFGAGVIWVEGDEAGLEFDFPLHPAVVECLNRIYPSDQAA